jgi:drug/metabolite transporter (DMT)-like permease
MPPRNYSHYLELHFVVFLFGFTAILGKLITLPVELLLLYRTGIAALGMAALISYRRSWRVLSVRQILQLMAVGLMVAAHWYCFFMAARVSNVAISLVGLATAPLWVALLGPLFGLSKLSILEIALGLLVLVGLYIIFLVEIAQGWGLILSVLSGFGAAVFTMLNGRLVKKQSALVISFFEMLGAAMAVLLYTQAKHIPITWPQPIHWLWLLLLGLLCTVYAFAAIVRLLQYIPAFSVNLAINLEPIYGILLAFFIFGQKEHMSLGFYIGTAVILLAVFGYQLSRRYEKPL